MGMRYPCNRCKARQKNRPGGLCHVCYEELNGEYEPEKPAPKPPTLTDEEETMLSAMRHVSLRPESEDKTFQQEEMRRWQREDRTAFNRHRATLEAKCSFPTLSDTTSQASTTRPSSNTSDPARERVRESLEAEFEIVKFAQANRAAILEYMAKRAAFLAWEAERAAAMAE
jgi:hypothetical protein